MTLTNNIYSVPQFYCIFNNNKDFDVNTVNAESAFSLIIVVIVTKNMKLDE